jgi:cyclomaltodextrinase
VNIAGDFNDWHRNSCSLTNYPCGVWETVIPLKKGVYQYKFIVDGIWTHDPSNPCMMVNEFGGVNSALEVTDDANIRLPNPSCGARGYGKLRAVSSPDWLQDAIIYEVFPRAFSAEGTLDAVRRRIPELRNLGVTCIWLMPIHPIGVCSRKGILGSPYAISDYRSIHPDLGTLEDLKRLVRTAHGYGMKVIMDFVANHSAVDCMLQRVHPDWYERDSHGRPQSPGFGWTDVLGFDYRSRDLRDYMIETMRYYIKECDIDGYRCDVAALVPTDFWREAREAIKKLKPDAILLAESHEPSHNATAFDLTYEENLPQVLQRVFLGTLSARAIRHLIEEDRLTFPVGSMRMRYLENHDQPRAVERLGVRGLKVAAALLFTLDGAPLINNGQEIGEHRRVSLFDPSKIQWESGDYIMRELYRHLSHMRNNVPALRRGSLTFLNVARDDSVLGYYREYEDSRIVVLLNFTCEMIQTKVGAPKELVRDFADVGYRFTELNGHISPLCISGQGLLGREATLDPYGIRIFSLEAISPCRCIA